jgi:hypothetical protein
MDPTNEQKQTEPEEPRFLNFPCLPDGTKDAQGKPALNKYSSTITRGHDFPGAQVNIVAMIQNSHTDMTSGNALCCWSSRQADNVDSSSCRSSLRMVGRKSVQVRYQHSYLTKLYGRTNKFLACTVSLSCSTSNGFARVSPCCAENFCLTVRGWISARPRQDSQGCSAKAGYARLAIQYYWCI